MISLSSKGQCTASSPQLQRTLFMHPVYLTLLCICVIYSTVLERILQFLSNLNKLSAEASLRSHLFLFFGAITFVWYRTLLLVDSEDNTTHPPLVYFTIHNWLSSDSHAKGSSIAPVLECHKYQYELPSVGIEPFKCKNLSIESQISTHWC